MWTSTTPRWALFLRSPGAVGFVALCTIACIIACICVVTLTPETTPTPYSQCCSVDGWDELYCARCDDASGYCSYADSVCAAHPEWESCCFDSSCLNVPSGALFAVCDTHSLNLPTDKQGFMTDMQMPNWTHWPLFACLIGLAISGAFFLMIRVMCVHSVEHDARMMGVQHQQSGQVAYYAQPLPPHIAYGQQPPFGYGQQQPAYAHPVAYAPALGQGYAAPSSVGYAQNPYQQLPAGAA